MIREYNNSDRQVLDRMMFELQNYFAEIDSAGENRSFDSIEEASSYLDTILDDVQKMNGKIFVAVENDEIVGFIQGVIVNKNGCQHKRRKDGWVGLLFVKDEYRGKNIGDDLLSEMQRYFRESGCDTMRLLTLADNKNAIDFYERAGMKVREIEMAIKIN